MERGTGKERAWVFRLLDEKWKKEMIQSYKKDKGVSIIIWVGSVEKIEQIYME